MKFIILTVLFVAAANAQYKGPTNQAGLNLIKEYEGWFPDFYIDPVGIRTIGYGHACHVWDCSVPLNGKYPVPLTLSDGESLLQDDLSYPGFFEDCVADQVKYSGLDADQYSAIVSFTFNLGCGALSQSSLLRELNNGNVVNSATEFSRWIYAGGKPFLGLIRRRDAERKLFCSGGKCDTGCKGKANISSGTLNIRINPSASSDITGGLVPGENVEIFKRVTGDSVSGNPYWFHVGKGYVSAHFVDLTSASPSWCSK